jgi:hypothetical protein
MRGDDETEHGVAEELQSFVGLLAGGLRAVRPVDDREAQEVGIDPYAEPLSKCVRRDRRTARNQAS